jgi:hypothetical protein
MADKMSSDMRGALSNKLQRKSIWKNRNCPGFKSGVAERYESFAGPGLDEYAVLKESVFKKEIGCPVEIYNADSPTYDPKNKPGLQNHLGLLFI